MLPFVGVGAIEDAGEEEARRKRKREEERKRPPIEFAPVSDPPRVRARAAPPRLAVLRSSYNVPADALTAEMRKELTLEPKRSEMAAAAGPPVRYEAFTIRGAIAAVPRYWGGVAFGEPKEASTTVGEPAPSLRFAGELLPHQTCAVAAIVARLTDKTTALHGAQLQAGCGIGKTVTGLAIAAALGRRTAILVHKDFLVPQWVRSVERFLPTARIGIVQRDRVEIDADVVIFMMASVVGGRYGPEVFAPFGLLVVDECHHLCARTFMNAARVFPADARLGLTATPDRRDGLGYALAWFLGPVAFRIRRNAASVAVRMARYVGGARSEITMRNGKIAYTKMVTRLVDDPRRTAGILDIVRGLLAEGRRVIVMSDRRDHLKAMHDALGPEVSGLYVGETTKRGRAAREDSAEKRVVLATSGMAEEGLDIPMLDSIVIVTPKSSLSAIEQAVGRVLRTHPQKRHAPLVVDVYDPFSVFAGMQKKRQRYYESQGYAVSQETFGGDDGQKK